LDESKDFAGEYKEEQLSMNLDRVEVLDQLSPRHCLPSSRCAAVATTYGHLRHDSIAGTDSNWMDQQ
jgi:hypothetical protein